MFDNSKSIKWIKNTADNKQFCYYLAFTLFICVLSFFLLDSAKLRNNIYYIFFVIPALLAFIFNTINKKPPKFDHCLYALLLYFMCGMFASVLSQNDPFAFFRHTLCLFALFYGLSLCINQQNFCAKITLGYFLACCILIIISIYLWQDIYFSIGILPRITLYASAANPVHASLMILTGWISFWIVYALPKLLKFSRLAYFSGFILMQSLGFLICIIFQSRSSLLGLLAVTTTLLILGNERRITLLIIFLFIIVILTGNYHEGLLQRGTSYRFEIWQDVLMHLNNNASWLTGINNEGKILYLGKFHHPHSAYLSILAHTGIIGAVPFSLFACTYVIQGIKKKSPWFIVSMLGWVAVSTTSNGVIDSPQPLLIYFWIPTFLAMTINYQKN